MNTNIRAIRRAKGLSQGNVASKVESIRGGNVSARWIGRLESGKENMPESTLEQIANALGVTVELLIQPNLKSIPL